MLMRFIKLAKPLQYAVYSRPNVLAIPAGARGVEIAFRQSWMVRDGVRLNVYRWRGQLVHVK